MRGLGAYWRFYGNDLAHLMGYPDVGVVDFDADDVIVQKVGEYLLVTIADGIFWDLHLLVELSR